MYHQTITAWDKSPLRQPAPAGLVEALSSNTLLTVVRESGGWVLQSDSRVGVVIGEGWDIRVIPKIEIPRLIFMLGYASDPAGWQQLVAPMRHEDDLYTAIASGFAHHARRALAPGALRGYVNLDEATSVFRGRMRIGDQITHRAGLPMPVEISRDEHTVDIPENRLVAAAARILLRVPRVPDLARAQLRRVDATLAEVASPKTFEMPAITRLNRRYEPAMRLANLILRHRSIGTDHGAAQSVAFVFDMNKVFEDFIGAALAEAVRASGDQIILQYDKQFLDAERQLRLRPDITLWHRGQLTAVVDAKYKRLTPKSFPNADAYQMLAYCQAFGLPIGTLVYARDEGQHDEPHHLPGGVAIDVTTIDVRAEPRQTLAQVARLAARLITAQRLDPRVQFRAGSVETPDGRPSLTMDPPG